MKYNEKKKEFFPTLRCKIEVNFGAGFLLVFPSNRRCRIHLWRPRTNFPFQPVCEIIYSVGVEERDQSFTTLPIAFYQYLSPRSIRTASHPAGRAFRHGCRVFKIFGSVRATVESSRCRARGSVTLKNLRGCERVIHSRRIAKEMAVSTAKVWIPALTTCRLAYFANPWIPWKERDTKGKRNYSRPSLSTNASYNIWLWTCFTGCNINQLWLTKAKGRSRRTLIDALFDEVSSETYKSPCSEHCRNLVITFAGIWIGGD